MIGSNEEPQFNKTRYGEQDQQLVVKNEKGGILNTGKRDVGSDDEQKTINARNVMAHTKTDFLSQLISVADKAA